MQGVSLSGEAAQRICVTGGAHEAYHKFGKYDLYTRSLFRRRSKRRPVHAVLARFLLPSPKPVERPFQIYGNRNKYKQQHLLLLRISKYEYVFYFSYLLRAG